MNRPFWSRQTVSPSICDALEPLLPLYADGLASPAETRRVETHLPGCKTCRTELSWIRATHAALASRPVAVPPPDLHSRIALAIAASAAPITLRPARAFSLRPVYAAAASLTALGIALSYPLWHTPGEVVVKHPVQHNVIASVPAVKPHALLPKATKQPLVASNPVKHMTITHKMPPAGVTPLEHVASNTLPETKLETKSVLAPLTVKTPAHRLVPGKKLALNRILPPEKHNTPPAEIIVMPKADETPKIAKVSKEPALLHLDIKPPIIIVPPPPVQTASAHSSPAASNDPLRDFKSQLREKNAQMRNVSYTATRYTRRLADSGATNVMGSMDDSSRVVTFGDIHGNQ